MRKQKYPGWNQWQTIIKGLVQNAVNKSGLVGYRINSAPTKKNIVVNGPERLLGSFPFVSVALTDWERGWDADNSGQPDYSAKNYTSLGGSKVLESLVPVKERITFSIETFTGRYDEVIEIMDVIHKYFGPLKTLTFDWNNSTYDIDIKLHSYALEIAEGSKEGQIEFFHGSWALTIYAITESLDADSINKAITSVITDLNTQIEDTEGTSTEKTLT